MRCASMKPAPSTVFSVAFSSACGSQPPILLCCSKANHQASPNSKVKSPIRPFSPSSKGGSMRLQNKVAIVTGAAHGIGKAYARGFAQEGAHLVIADVDRPGGEAVAKALVDSGLSAWARTTDVRSFADVEGLMRETVDRFGRLDILLNNAAIYVTQKLWKGRVEELAIEEWDRVLEVNLKGVFLCCKAVIPIRSEEHTSEL